MAVSYRSGSKGQSSTAATSASVTQPTGAAAGDCMVVGFTVKDAQKFNIKTGWELEETHNGNGTAPFTTGVYRRTLDGTESWPISFGWTGSSVKWAWAAAAFQPATGGNVVVLDSKPVPTVDTNNVTTHTANSQVAVAGNVTSVIVNCGRRTASSATGATVTPPTNWTEDATNGDVTTASGTGTTLAQLGVEIAYRTGQSGTIAPGSSTWSQTVNANVHHYLLTEITPGTFTRTIPPPDEVSQSGGVASSVTAFTPPANSLVRIGFSWLDATDQLGKTFTVKDSNNVSYTQKQMGGDADGGCYNGFYDHQYTTSPGPITITVTCAGTGNTAQADCLIQPFVFTGHDPDQSTAAQNQFSEAGTSTNTYLIAVTPTRLGSTFTVAGAPNHNSGSTGPVDANDATVTVVDWDNSNVGSRGTFGTSAVATSALSSVTFGWTSVGASPFGYGIMATEVLPASGATVNGTASPSASSSLAAGAVQGSGAVLAASAILSAPAVQRSGASLAAAGSLAAGAVQGAGASLAATASLAAPAVQRAGAALTAAAALSSPAVQEAGASLTAASTLTASAGTTTSGTAALVASSSLTASAVQGTGAQLSAASSLTAAAAQEAGAALTAASALSAPAVQRAGAALTAVSALTAVAAGQGGAVLAASSSLSVPVVQRAAASLTAGSSLTAGAGSAVPGTSSLSAASSLTAGGLVLIPGTAQLAAASSLAAGSGQQAGAVLAAAASLSAPAVQRPGAVLAAAGSLTATGTQRGPFTVGILTSGTQSGVNGSATYAPAGATSTSSGVLAGATSP